MAYDVELEPLEAGKLAYAACLGAGAGEDAARSLADATLSAHLNGRPEVGFAHLLDYLVAFRAGRINGNAEPRLHQPLPAFWQVDADGGIAQLAFDRVFDRFVATANTLGIALLTQRNGYTTGELGYYARRLAEKGLVTLAFTNANAFLAPSPGKPRVYSTNPHALGFPLGEGRRPLVIDQSASATAFVNVVAAARKGERLEAGMAVDASGEPTCDPVEAMTGALLPFGGRKGGNIALLVELMAAGLSGGAWSMDMKDFQSGDETLDVGLTVIGIRSGPETITRAAEQADRLSALGIYMPGTGERPTDRIGIDAETYAAVKAYAQA
jgi:LDH2 family malate/lactate/ureidoglycolate dehydrogenase